MRISIGCMILLAAALSSVCHARTEIPAVRATVPPRIDGKLDDPCWREANALTDFTVLDTTRKSDFQTRGFLAYDDTNLYIAMNCLDPAPKSILAKVAEGGEVVFQDDNVEIMSGVLKNGHMIVMKHDKCPTLFHVATRPVD